MRRLLLAILICGVAVAVAVGCLIGIVGMVGKGVSADLPTVSRVSDMGIKTQAEAIAAFGQPSVREKHYDYVDPTLLLAEHWDYLSAAREGNITADVIFWWRPDGSLAKISFRVSETGEVLR